MKKFLKDYFTFNKGDRNGILVLLALIFLLLLYLTFMDRLVPSRSYDYSTFDKLVAELESARKDALAKKERMRNKPYNTAYSDSSRNDLYRKTNLPQQLFAFNPNQLPEEKWKALGLSDKQVASIKRYEEKGGKFFRKEDVKKMYVIGEKLYAQLESYIQIPARPSKDSLFAKRYKTEKDSLYKKAITPPVAPPPPALEINSADSSKLKSLKGIGPAFAKRILSYREKLGGFISFNQLYEIWGIDSETVKSILPQLTLNTAMVRKIPINHCSVSELKKHPYLNYNIANNIVLYRDRHGEYAKVQDIKQAVLVNEELFRKIAPYLTLE